MGSDSDAALARVMNTFANMLDIKRDRGEPQPIEGTLAKSGERVIIDPGGKPRLPTSVKIDVTGEKPKFQINAQDKKEAIQILQGLKKKYPELDYNQAIESIKVHQFDPKEQIQGKIEFGDECIFPAIAKSAINFYIHNDGDRRFIVHLLPFINGLAHSRCVGYFYPEKLVIEEFRRDVLHKMFLVGDPTQKILYCVVSYFNSMDYVVLLNDSYDGKELAYMHTIHPGLKVSQERKALRFLDRSEIIDAVNTLDMSIPDRMIEKVRDVIKTAFEKQATMREFEALVDKAFKSVKVEEGELTSDFMIKILKELEVGIMPMIEAASRRRHIEAEEDFKKELGLSQFDDLLIHQSGPSNL